VSSQVEIRNGTNFTLMCANRFILKKENEIKRMKLKMFGSEKAVLDM